MLNLKLVSISFVLTSRLYFCVFLFLQKRTDSGVDDAKQLHMVLNQILI